jgi:hypothetical protein
VISGAVVVGVRSTDTVQFRRKLGNFWPLKVYALEKGGAKPNKKDITTHLIFGKKERGIILDDSHGFPIGAVEMWANSEKGTYKDAALGNSGDMDADEGCRSCEGSQGFEAHIEAR